MEVFAKRQQLFDFERFKGKNHNPIVEQRQEVQECSSEKLAEYKFKKMINRYRPDKMAKTFFTDPESD